MTKNNSRAQTKQAKPAQTEKRPIPVFSSIGPAKELIELVYDRQSRRARLAVWKNGRAYLVDSYSPDAMSRLVPHRTAVSLIAHNVLKFAQAPMEYGETADLVDAIRAYIRRYVDVSEAFERLAANYVLLTWVHDRFNELPYLRRRGDYGTGKTRFLTVLGSICYKPIFAGGASTTSPIFHLLDLVGGTLVIDEADFRFSDESALIAKILNAGNVKGYPVLRSESANGNDFRPRAFKVFGPKIAGMRGRYDDPALESRFLTETSTNPTERKDVPINLPVEQSAEAAILRDKLLLYRFRNFERLGTPPQLDEAFQIEPRMHQILAPLMSVANDETDRQAILAHASAAQETLNEARGQSLEAEVLTVIKKLMAQETGAGVSIQDIATAHGRAFLETVGRAMSPRAMGHVVRTKLNLKTVKSHGVFIIPKTQHRALERLYARYNVAEADMTYLAEQLGETRRVDFGEKGDVVRKPRAGN